NRTSFALNESLSWTDNDRVCGMTYEYEVWIDYGVVNDPGRNAGSAVGIVDTLAYEAIVIPPSLGCSPDDPGNVDLTTELDDANVMQIDWAFSPDAVWPQDPPLDNGLRIQ